MKKNSSTKLTNKLSKTYAKADKEPKITEIVVIFGYFVILRSN